MRNGISYSWQSALLALTMFALAACAEQPSDGGGAAPDPSPWLVTPEAVGPWRLGDDWQAFRQRLDAAYETEPAPGARYGFEGDGAGLVVRRGGEDLFFAFTKNDRTLDGFVILSPRYYTQKGVRVGMNAEQLRRLYPDLRLRLDAELPYEIFSPADMQTFGADSSPVVCFHAALAAPDGRLAGRYAESGAEEFGLDPDGAFAGEPEADTAPDWLEEAQTADVRPEARVDRLELYAW